MTVRKRSTAASRTRLTGRLIVLEGPDGVGKSTVSAAVAETLKATGPCEHLSFPGREKGTLGQLVYRLHHDHDALGVDTISPDALQTLHIAAHLDAITRRIAPALEAGTDVVLDRFWWSTLVYGVVAGLDRVHLTALTAVERHAWGRHQPSLAVLLRRDTPISRDDEPRDRWLALRAEYDALAAMEGATTPVLVLDNAPHALSARDSILAALATRVPHAPGTPGKGSRLPTPRVSRDARRSDAPSPVAAHSPGVDSPSQSHTSDFNPAVREGSADWVSPTPVMIFVPHLAPAKVTTVYDTYWRFAAERQAIFFRRIDGVPAPWTDDAILATYKFTNAYRAADRVSQYLIRRVIYREDLPTSVQEICFRILLFKLFNRIETWEALESQIGPPTWEGFRFVEYDRVLADAMAAGRRIYSAAYIMPPGGRTFGHSAKHRNHLALLEHMMRDGLPQRIADAPSMQRAFELLKSYPTIGDFLAYQFVTDINYSDVTHFSEMEFVVPGPGALSGLTKCFAHRGGLNEPELIRLMADVHQEEFARLGVTFRSLWGRPLQLIDCQNLFCEVDKYSRVRHPNVAGRGGRTQIKQRHSPNIRAIDYWFPPKWKINDRIACGAKAVAPPR